LFFVFFSLFFLFFKQFKKNGLVTSTFLLLGECISNTLLNGDIVVTYCWTKDAKKYCEADKVWTTIVVLKMTLNEF